MGRLARRLAGPAALLSLALLAGRATGFLRELFLAGRLGVSHEADLAVLWLTLPDLLVNVLLSGGLSVALVPALRREPGPRAQALFRQASLAVAGLFLVLAAVIVLQPMLLFGLLAPGISADAVQAHRDSLAVLAIALPLTALSGVTTAYLNAMDRFFIAGCGTLVFNLCLIAALAAGPRDAGMLMALSAGVAGGAFLRWASQLAALPGGALRPAGATGWLIDRPLMHAFTASLLSASLMLAVPVIVRSLASLVGGGAIAAFNYATKLVELPSGLAVTVLATVAFPLLAQLHQEGREDVAAAQVAARLRQAVAMAVALMLPGVFFCDAVVALLFGHGRMDAAALAEVALLGRIALLGLPAIAVSSMLTADLNAQGRTGMVLRLTAWCLLLLLPLAFGAQRLHSAAALMGAVVAFQFALAAVLSWRARRLPWGKAGWLDSRMLVCIATAALGCLLLSGIARVLDIRSAVAGSALALAAVALSVWSARRMSDIPAVPPASPE